MITKKAEKLSKKANGGDVVDARNLYDELIDHCCPTREEFCDLLVGVKVTVGIFWDGQIYIPRWINGIKGRIK